MRSLVTPAVRKGYNNPSAMWGSFAVVACVNFTVMSLRFRGITGRSKAMLSLSKMISKPTRTITVVVLGSSHATGSEIGRVATDNTLVRVLAG